MQTRYDKMRCTARDATDAEIFINTQFQKGAHHTYCTIGTDSQLASSYCGGMNTIVRRILVVGGNGFIGTNYFLNYDNLCAYYRIPVRFCSLQGRAQARNPGDECEVG